MKNNKIFIYVGLFTLFAVVGGWVVTSGRLNTLFYKKNKFLSESDRLAALRKKDLEVLARANAPDGEVYTALVRLAQTKDPVARQEAVKRSKSESVSIRRGSAQALGYFDDEESLGLIVQMTNDKDPVVRNAALEGLGQGQGNIREKAITEILKKPNIAKEQKLLLLIALLRVTRSQTTKESLAKQLLHEVNSEKNDELSLKVMTTLMGLMPRNSILVQMLEKTVQMNRPLALVPQSIRHLGAVGSQWLKENLKTTMSYSDPQSRQASIQVLHFICPVNRWSVLDEVMDNERDRTVVDAALRQTLLMPGSEAKAFLERQIASEKTLPNEKELAKALLQQVSASTSVDPCLK